MHRTSPASFLASILLHAGLLALLLISIQLAPKTLPASSVPVEIVSEVPSHEMAAAPVDETAVKTPVPEPAPEEQPKPAPPTPAPPQPVPQPQKVVTPPAPKPVPKPTPAPPKTQAPPDKKGTQKPVPPKPAKQEPALDLGKLSQLPSSPSKSPTRTLPQANTHATNGNSAFGAAPMDAGTKTALDALTQKLARLWSPNCDVPGGNKIVPEIMFTLSPNGRVIKGPEWLNKNADAVWVAGANRAMAAVAKGQPYDDLPPGLYNVPLKIKFDARKACQNM